jgi:putative FmdB family regulatory protein
MPTYEYRCPDGHEVERFVRKISDAQSEVECPVCGKVAPRRMSLGGGLLFKGSGFYLTDYGKNAHRGGAPEKSGAGEGGGGESKSGGDGATKGESASAAPAASGGGGGESSTAKPSAAPKAAAEPKKPAESKPSKPKGDA